MKEQIEKFIDDELKELLQVKGVISPRNIEEEICRLLMRAKFRRKAASNSLKKRVQEAVAYNVSNDEPINITFLQGCYKLWRFEESPEADWAEFFALMHYATWVKPILSFYKPGVIFDFFVDDLIMEKISNLRRDEILSYQSSFQKIINFVMSHCPKNLHCKITTVSSRYSNESDFWDKLNTAVENWEKPENIKLDEMRIATIELNYRPIPNENHSALWREKIARIYAAHAAMENRLKYREKIGKILAMPHHYDGFDTRIFLGSTKDSNIKYWIGVGALKHKNEDFIPTVLSPSQLANVKFSTHNVAIKGLDTKNFKKIRVINTDVNQGVRK